MSRAVASRLDLPELFAGVVSETCNLLHADRATMFLLDHQTDELWALVGEGMSHTIRIPRHAGIVGSCVQTGQIINIPDAYEDSRFNQSIDKKTGYRTTSILCMRIDSDDGDILGALQGYIPYSTLEAL